MPHRFTARPAVFLAAALLAMSVCPVEAQFQPPVKSGQAAAVVSPEIATDRQVTFRLRAPKAAAVELAGPFLKGKTRLARGADGVWSVTLGPLAPDIYEYNFVVDGLAMIDPGNREVKPMPGPRMSILDIPGEPPLLHDFQDVPHGKVALQWYVSKSLGRRRPMQVYTPPEYDRDPAARFPVLYLLHGSGDTEATWVAHGRAHWILDNLIAQGRARPMIVVMLEGHAAAQWAGPARLGNILAFERDLLEDAMPLVERSYRVRIEGAADRAIAGLSMGGSQSFYIGLKHPELFAWVCGMSSAVGDAEVFLGDAVALNRRLKLFWLACGRADPLIRTNRESDAALTARGIRHEYVETEGNHSWPVWRHDLEILAPRLFQE